MATEFSEALLTMGEAAMRLRVSTYQLRKIREDGRIGYTKIGSKYMFTPTDIEEYLLAQRVAPIEPKRRASARKS
jgi:excisionase family DNA binding protein